MATITEIPKRLAGRFGRDDIPGLGAEMAYRFLFAIFPFGLFVAALIAFVAPVFGIASPTDKLMGALGDNLPQGVADTLRPELERVIDTTRPGLLSIGALAALWAATGGTMALMKGLNRAYEIDETRSFLTRYLVGIGLTLLGAVGIIASFVTIIGGALLTQEIAEQLGLSGTAWTAIQLLRWPIVLVLLVVAVAILYRYAPNARAPWRWLIVGATVFTIGWLIATWALGLYVANVADYGATYGSLGGVIVLMLWFYVTSILLVVGGQVAAVAIEVLEPGALQVRRDEIAQSQPLREVSERVRDAAEETTTRVREALPGDGQRAAGDGRLSRPSRGRSELASPSVHAIRRERPED